MSDTGSVGVLVAERSARAFRSMGCPSTIGRRLDPTPPTVVVRRARPCEKDRMRALSSALRDGAFAVLDRPVQIELMLEIMRRILRRYYKDVWPSA